MDNEANGVLALWKPRGMTSFAAVREIKKLYKTKKVGHTGTLDPDVDGVLPVCLGRATKLVEYLTADRKTYEGEVTIGYSTTTEDQSGEIVEQKPVDRPVSEAEINGILDNLKGDIVQVPPMFSAVKVQGKRLYEYARKGLEVERPQRLVTIYDIALTSDITKTEAGYVRFRFRVSCSKGTYIRTLSVTIGEMLGFPAHMSDLTRTRSGMFTADNAVTFEQLHQWEEQDELHQPLLSIESVLSAYPKKVVDAQLETKIVNGAIIPASEINMDESLIALYNQHGVCLALYESHPRREGMMKPAKMLHTVGS
ncbi:tRNA pseudouridine55 synthase [Evansella caseinilytica]|uniref:tRNA pseudouridine synthase B n=1 Tax=Evansella caseinilytica TaxID=1503961 RepID=A0A1H3M1G0_9BACI|nr:tRNA pseudouridine(55) synthase TruB [Evansella caseinilytica]SDY70403.1 tRNA pseudouridine55 synthase [Evansella caseinilytica]